LPKKDANFITRDNGKAWRITKELVEREAEKIAVELCCREEESGFGYGVRLRDLTSRRRNKLPGKPPL
jgi:hypothetical protein